MNRNARDALEEVQTVSSEMSVFLRNLSKNLADRERDTLCGVASDLEEIVQDIDLMLPPGRGPRPL